MNKNTFLLALLLLFISPLIFADEMGTGSEENSSANVTTSAPEEESSSTETECDFWQMVIDWFE